MFRRRVLITGASSGIGKAVAAFEHTRMLDPVTSIFGRTFATLEEWVGNGCAGASLAALIVCTQYPRINTIIQRAQSTFQKKYKSPLHVKTKR